MIARPHLIIESFNGVDKSTHKCKPELNHMRIIVNAAKTVAAFLVESYLFQQDEGIIQVAMPGAKGASDGAG